ncbi:MAG: hypothetical protein R3C04_04135 [Hyphomonas sp.]
MAKLPKEDQERAELNARFADFAGRMEIDGPRRFYPLRMKLAQRMTGPHRPAGRRCPPDQSAGGPEHSISASRMSPLIDVMVKAVKSVSIMRPMPPWNATSNGGASTPPVSPCSWT